jgi:hypothetical protein
VNPGFLASVRRPKRMSSRMLMQEEDGDSCGFVP